MKKKLFNRHLWINICPKSDLPQAPDRFGVNSNLLKVNLEAIATNNSTITAQSVTNGAGGTQVPVSVTLLNSGSTTWVTTGNNPYHLGANGSWGNQRVVLPNNVAPGQSVTLNFELLLPNASGTYPVQFQMVEELVQWFGAVTNLSVTVTAVPPTPTPSTNELPVPAPNDISSASVIISPPTIADGTVRSISWMNNTNQELKIRKVYVWLGVDDGVVADCDAEVYRIRTGDGSVFAALQMDRYDPNPNADTNEKQFNYENGFILGPTEGLQLDYFGHQYSGPAGGQVQARVIIWAENS